MDRFVALLLDFSFRKPATPHLVKFLYIFSLLLCGIQAVLVILAGFTKSIGSGIASLVLAPVVFLFLICVIRVGLEALISLYRTANYTAELARAQRPPMVDEEPAPPPPAPPPEPAGAPEGAFRETIMGKTGF